MPRLSPAGLRKGRETSQARTSGSPRCGRPLGPGGSAPGRGYAWSVSCFGSAAHSFHPGQELVAYFLGFLCMVRHVP